jgi:hypothetical protein
MHFLYSGYSKKRFERCRGSNVLSKRMAFRTDNLPPGRLKKRLWWSRWSEFHGVARTNELIFCILSIEKSDLDIFAYVMFYVCEFDEAMFHGVKSPKNSFSTSWAFDAQDVVSEFFGLGWSRLSNALCMRMALRNHNRYSERLEMRLSWSRWIDISWCRKVI